MKQEHHKGLTQKEAVELLSKFGENTITVAKKRIFPDLLVTQYQNIITLILFIASLFSFYIQEMVDGIFILLILILNGLFGFFQEFKAEKTLEKLKDFTVSKSHVIRDGSEKEIDTKDIVPEDVVVLREGDRIPADGISLSHVPLELDESVFSGESLSVEKKRGDRLFAGTFIMRGRGEMEVEKTGFSTKLGEIAQGIREIQKPKTPLSENLEQLGKRLALIALFTSALLIPIGILHNINLKEMVLTSVSIAVAVIPEGLPLVLTIALAVGAYRMAKEKTIVRKMVAIETLGSTNVILTDKTGTLTQNKMNVKKYWTLHKESLDLVLRAAVLGNSATLVLQEDGEKYDVLGDKTDAALLLFVKEHVSDLEGFRNTGTIVEEKPFDPLVKTIEVTWAHEGKQYIFLRGAPERIVSLIGEKDKKAIENKLLEYAQEGLRVIGFAYRKHQEKEFSFLGLVGIHDPPRAEAKDAIQKARAAGIRVVMVTGDNPVTALAISEEIGLIEKKEMVLTSSEIEKLPDDELIEAIPRVRVFARMQPKDKLRLVRLYRRAGYVVAVTGDGVNDALALAQANIGVAMGQTGTDVAKEAADIVITDDNLATIVKAVEEGRGIFHNITRVVLYLLASNAAEFLVIFVGILIGLPILFSPTQILWINLVTDGFPALALASDTKRKGLLTLSPRKASEQILNRQRGLYIFKIASVLTIITISTYWFLLTFIPEYISRLIVFNLFVIAELLIVFIIRGGIFPINKFLIISVLASCILQIFIMSSPVLRSIFS